MQKKVKYFKIKVKNVVEYSKKKEKQLRKENGNFCNCHFSDGHFNGAFLLFIIV